MGGGGEEGEMRLHSYYSCLIWMKKQGLPVRGGIGDGEEGQAAQLCEEARVSSCLGVFLPSLTSFCRFLWSSGFSPFTCLFIFTGPELAVRVLYILGVLFNFFIGLSHAFLFLYVWAFFFVGAFIFFVPNMHLLVMVYCGPLMTQTIDDAIITE